MKIVLAGTMAAVAAALALANAPREQDPSGRSSAVPPAASSSSGIAPAPDASPPRAPAAPPPPQPQGGRSSADSEPVSSGPSPADAIAPAPQVSDAQLAALQQLVEQSRQENERLARIDYELASARRQSDQQQLSAEADVEQAAAQHAATLQALDILRQADALLATGDSDGVDDQLVRAEAALTGRTRIDVDAAREALERSDLYAARLYLTAALAERRSLR